MKKQKSQKSKTEQFKVSGKEMVEKVKEIIHEGNVRRIIIKNEAGNTIIDIPITIAGIGTLMAPWLAALGAIAALVTNCTIVVKRKKTFKPWD